MTLFLHLLKKKNELCFFYLLNSKKDCREQLTCVQISIPVIK